MNKKILIGLTSLISLVTQSAAAIVTFDFDDPAQDANFQLNRRGFTDDNNGLLSNTITSGSGDRTAFALPSRSIQMTNGASLQGIASAIYTTSHDMSTVGASTRISAFVNHHRISAANAISMSRIGMAQFGLLSSTAGDFEFLQSSTKSVSFQNGNAFSIGTVEDNSVVGSSLDDSVFFTDVFLGTNDGNSVSGNLLRASDPTDPSTGFESGQRNQNTIPGIWYEYDIEFISDSSASNGIVDQFLVNSSIVQYTQLEVGNQIGPGTVTQTVFSSTGDVTPNPFTAAELAELYPGVGRSGDNFRAQSATFYDNLTIETTGAAVPEPSGAILTSLGILGFFFRRKR